MGQPFRFVLFLSRLFSDTYSHISILTRAPSPCTARTCRVSDRSTFVVVFFFFLYDLLIVFVLPELRRR